MTERGEACLSSGHDSPPWIAVRTRSNFEFQVAKYLRGRGLFAWCPSYSHRRRWSDRVKLIETPLLPGYVLCRCDPAATLPVRQAPGVVHIVGFGDRPAVVPDHEVESLSRLVRSGLPASPSPYLREGAPIRILRGPLQGLEGILLRVKNRFHFVVSVHLIQRSVCAEVNAEDVVAAA